MSIAVPGSNNCAPTNPYDGCSSNTVLVDNMLGTAYTTVRIVAEHIEHIKHISFHLAQVFRVSNDLENIDDVSANLPAIQALHENMQALLTVFVNLDMIDNVNDNIIPIQIISTNMAKLNSLFAQLDKLVMLEGELDIFQEVHAHLANIDIVSTYIDAVIDVSENLQSLLSVIEEVTLARNGYPSLDGRLDASDFLLGSAVQEGDTVQTLVDGTTKKLMTDVERTKLAGIATGATANATDASLRDRGTHTGEQAMTTITGLPAALAAKATPSDIANAIAALVGEAPAALDAVYELAAALGNDPNFATTVSTAMGNRLRFDAAQTLSADQKLQGQTNLGVDPTTLDARYKANLEVSGYVNAYLGAPGINGYATVNAGGPTNSGYVQFRQKDGTRTGYIGNAGSGDKRNALYAENGYSWEMLGLLRLLDGAVSLGDIEIQKLNPFLTLKSSGAEYGGVRLQNTVAQFEMDLANDGLFRLVQRDGAGVFQRFAMSVDTLGVTSYDKRPTYGGVGLATLNEVGSGSGVAGVSSFKGRGGPVVPEDNDYTLSQISGAADALAGKQDVFDVIDGGII